MPLPTWDVFIGLAFLVGIGYGFILRREKAITTLCSTYIGLVIATTFSQTVFDFFNGNKVLGNQLWIRSNAPLPVITAGIFILATFFISGAINSSSSRSTETSPLEVIIYSALNMALILSCALTFLTPEMRVHIFESSRFAKLLYDMHTVIVIAPPLSLVVLNFRHK